MVVSKLALTFAFFVGCPGEIGEVPRLPLGGMLPSRDREVEHRGYDV